MQRTRRRLRAARRRPRIQLGQPGRAGTAHRRGRSARFVRGRRRFRPLHAGRRRNRPARDRSLEEMPAGMQVEVLLEIPEARDRQSLDSAAHVNLVWLERNGEAPGERLERALRELPAGADDTFYWIATASHRARAMRLFLSNERGVTKEWLRATGYWTLGAEDAECRDQG